MSLGLDIGTSSVKGLLQSEDGALPIMLLTHYNLKN